MKTLTSMVDFEAQKNDDMLNFPAECGLVECHCLANVYDALDALAVANTPIYAGMPFAFYPINKWRNQPEILYIRGRKKSRGTGYFTPKEYLRFDTGNGTHSSLDRGLYEQGAGLAGFSSLPIVK